MLLHHVFLECIFLKICFVLPRGEGAIPVKHVTEHGGSSLFGDPFFGEFLSLSQIQNLRDGESL